MKKPILISLIALVTTLGAHAQLGTVTFDNGDGNPAATLASTTFGMVFIGTSNNPIPLNQDINVTLLGGNSAGSLTEITTLSFANGRAQGDNIVFGTPGQFADLSGNIYTIPGVPGATTAFLQVEAWLGPDATYAAALTDGSPVGTSAIYMSATGGAAITPGPPVSIGDAMPSFLVATPEPTTLAQCGLGAASLLLFRRRK